MSILRHVTTDEVAARVRFHGTPSVSLFVGPSRSGTTLFARIFAELGVHTWYQPLKAILRGYQHGLQTSLSVETSDPIAIKETLGAYTLSEATVDAVSVLIRAGVSPSNLHFVPLVREPLATAASIIEHFSGHSEREDLIEVLIASYETLDAVATGARAAGVSTTAIAYEVWFDNSLDRVLRTLLPRLGMTLPPSLDLRWDPVMSLKDLPNLHWLPEPDHYYNHTDFFVKVRRARTVSYTERRLPDIRRVLSAHQIARLGRSRAHDIYEQFRLQSIQDLGLSIQAPHTTTEAK